MALADAGRHDWLEQREPALTLMGFMDDATSQVLAVRFEPGPEDTAGYLTTLWAMVEIHGVPCSLYRDQQGTFQRDDPYRRPELSGKGLYRTPLANLLRSPNQ